MAQDENVGDGTNVQEEFHGEGHDYVKGSPHLRHRRLREWIESEIREIVRGHVSRDGECKVLEIGAGHGGFTDVCVKAGGSVWVTEMSRHSRDRLERRFADDDRVTVVFDEDGSAATHLGLHFDVILMVAVLHHIPDYRGVVLSLVDESLRPGGSFVSFQDPLWYPTQSRWALIAGKMTYYAWRITQGDLKRGLRTRLRRIRGRFDDSEPADLVEYHVVRKGVDQAALEDDLRRRFSNVAVVRYFSTQGPVGQAMGDRLAFPANTFGLRCVDRGGQQKSAG